MEITDFFTHEEINIIIREQNGLTHPIIDLVQDSVDSSGYTDLVKYNTLQSLFRIKIINKSWFDRKRKILLNKDRYNASAALGEFQCYSSIVDTFGEKNVIAVKENKVPTPDFQIINGKETINIEVNTIQINKNEADRLIDYHNTKSDKSEIREIFYCPYGIKQGFTTTQTVIRKLFNAKTDSLQFSNDYPNILWVDLQDEYMRTICDRIARFVPIYSGRYIGGSISGFCSNELWYSLYAPQGLAIFDGVIMNDGEGIKKRLPQMEFDGKFANGTFSYIDAIIYSGPKNKIICENPFAHHSFPTWFLDKLTEMNGFLVESSIFSFLNMKPNDVIKKEINFVKKLSKKSFYCW